MRELAKWYKEGLIDSEVFTRDTSSRDYILNNNLGGFTCDWFSSTGNYNSKLKEAIPGFDFSVILPVEYNGTRSTAFSRENYLGGWSISKTAKDPVDIIKYFDFWYTEEGRRLWNFGIEGEDYIMVNGKPKFTDKVLKNPEGRIPLMVLRETGAQYRLGMFQDGENERPEQIAAKIYNYEIDENGFRQVTRSLHPLSLIHISWESLNASLVSIACGLRAHERRATPPITSQSIAVCSGRRTYKEDSPIYCGKIVSHIMGIYSLNMRE